MKPCLALLLLSAATAFVSAGPGDMKKAMLMAAADMMPPPPPPDPKMLMKLMHKYMPRRVDYYVASSQDDDCGSPPSNVMKGDPMRGACQAAGSSGDAEICLCVRAPELANLVMDMVGMGKMLNKETGFAKACGRCEDPCELRFRPKMMMDGEFGMDSSEEHF